ncbi:MAG: hypothetical protein WB785_19645 [Mycobacterium sp.]|uniref:hypothetical protein n=1 Tax=Mycobacterium sp. TaxID=1785 RepID=UPI003C4C8ED9
MAESCFSPMLVAKSGGTGSSGLPSNSSVTNARGAEELAEILRRWLGHMDAIRWSTADMELPLLLQASAEHLGSSD